MINGCIKGADDCGCECHRIPGVKHVMPCCDKPPMVGTRLSKPDGTEWIWLKAPEGATIWTEWPISPLKVPITWIQDRDLGDEDSCPLCHTEPGKPHPGWCTAGENGPYKQDE